MQNARLDEAQAGIKIARRKINNLRYADDTTVMTEKKKKKEGTVMYSLKRRRKPDFSKVIGKKKRNVEKNHKCLVG